MGSLCQVWRKLHLFDQARACKQSDSMMSVERSSYSVVFIEPLTLTFLAFDAVVLLNQRGCAVARQHPAHDFRAWTMMRMCEGAIQRPGSLIEYGGSSHPATQGADLCTSLGHLSGSIDADLVVLLRDDDRTMGLQVEMLLPPNAGNVLNDVVTLAAAETGVHIAIVQPVAPALQPHHLDQLQSHAFNCRATQ